MLQSYSQPGISGTLVVAIVLLLFWLLLISMSLKQLIQSSRNLKRLKALEPKIDRSAELISEGRLLAIRLDELDDKTEWTPGEKKEFEAKKARFNEIEIALKALRKEMTDELEAIKKTYR